jgi:RHS repeat-associated protein
MTSTAAYAFSAASIHPPSYTGKERDTESGNDYFGARYYASNMGRFMSPDWSAQEEPVPYAKIDNPQSLNLYSYVYDNPLGGVDPDGHWGCSQEQASVCTAELNAISHGMDAGTAQQAGQEALKPLSTASEQAIQKSPLTGTQAGAFENAVVSAGKANLINPNLLVGLADKESGIDPTKDNDGARGLYQIRPRRQEDLGTLCSGS